MNVFQLLSESVVQARKTFFSFIFFSLFFLSPKVYWPHIAVDGGQVAEGEEGEEVGKYNNASDKINKELELSSQ